MAAAVRGIPLPPLTVNPDTLGPRAPRKDPLSAKLGGLNARLLLKGGFQALLGLPLLLWPGAIPIPLVTAVLAVWIGIEATQTLIGAIGLKRRGQGWQMWAGVGSLGIIFAIALFAGGLFALNLMIWIIMIGAGLRGLALLIVAMKASQTPGSRWALVLDGVLSLAIAVALLIWPLLGARLLRYGIGGYLTVSGFSTMAYAYGNHRAARKRIQHYLSQAF